MGVAWRGNRYPDGDGFRSFRLDALRPLAALPGVRLIGLQLKEGKEELDKLPTDMHVEVPGPDFDAGPDGFLDTAAVLALMDLVISCDTSIAHLAGALGRPLWIALNRTPEWRWQRQRTDTIWYPTARLFRQETNGRLGRGIFPDDRRVGAIARSAGRHVARTGFCFAQDRAARGDVLGRFAGQDRNP